MRDQVMAHMRRMSSWVLNPGCWIDRLLNQLEVLSIVLLGEVGNPPYREAKVKLRSERFGA